MRQGGENQFSQSVKLSHYQQQSPILATACPLFFKAIKMLFILNLIILKGELRKLGGKEKTALLYRQWKKNVYVPAVWQWP